VSSLFSHLFRRRRGPEADAFVADLHRGSELVAELAPRVSELDAYERDTLAVDAASLERLGGLLIGPPLIYGDEASVSVDAGPREYAEAAVIARRLALILARLPDGGP
jgi:hypothetical protein